MAVQLRSRARSPGGCRLTRAEEDGRRRIAAQSHPRFRKSGEGRCAIRPRSRPHLSSAASSCDYCARRSFPTHPHANIRSLPGTMILIDFLAYAEDSRGNRLENHRWMRDTDSGDLRLYLRGPDQIAKQVEWVLQAGGVSCKALPLPDEHRSDWTHRFAIGAAVAPAGTNAFLDLMGEVLVLQAPPGLDAAIALDFYKDPDSDEDPQKWKNTPAGELVSRAKYGRYVNAREELASQLASVIDRHPIYRGADFIVAVPGHDQSKRSYGEILAAKVADKTGKQLVQATAKSPIRPEAKARDEHPEIDLEDEFIVPDVVNGRPVIIVDDVCRSGETLRDVAVAARNVGSVAVLALVGARTMRRS
jgi:adenine/guanine phosphoribosyltransferase-like PRPP-binding protein